ncbi:hypothetical protein QGN23_03675 [Chryseobacterium gotjawalense]|uniref:Uncharacterized protein n=1 Tax=Chryseobacterium gotjawalense TaxID=3042315 RepID=A0ABY8REJ6_9FLAO|nr:hypothetical protein [Chryseobacterium sp. wdc7]WHF52385.1 hypothetical protein QGN23_03675 [Chryseobacterium sp. wdc7]
MFVRLKPDSVKQSPQTKAAARVFGLVSSREKMFRLQILRIMGIPALQYFAARHRARIRKTVSGDTGGSSGTTAGFGNPQALAGFSFNPKMEWESCTNFFPEVERVSNGEMKVHLPELKWKTQIIPPKNCSTAVLTFFAITADLNSPWVPLKVLSKIEMEISATAAVPATEWRIPTEPAEEWLLIVGCVKFAAPDQHSVPKEHFSAAYLWAQWGVG